MIGTYRKQPGDERRREGQSEYIPELCTQMKTKRTEAVSVLPRDAVVQSRLQRRKRPLLRRSIVWIVFEAAEGMPLPQRAGPCLADGSDRTW